MIMTNKKGVALIAAIMVAFIFLALGLALMLSVKGTLRQADTGRNNLIAYNLAEAGIADALFRLNYGTAVVMPPPDDNFPFTGEPNNLLVPSTHFDATNFSFEVPDITTPPSRVIDEIIYTPHTATTGDYYRVTAVNLGANHWKLISEGFYKGSYKKIEVRLRGIQDTGAIRQGLTQGIAEAFNKHAVYAYELNYGIGATPTIRGNVAIVQNTAFSPDGINNSLTLLPTPLIPPFLFNPPVFDDTQYPNPTLGSYTWDYIDLGADGDLAGGGGPTAHYTVADDTYTFSSGGNFNQRTRIQGNVRIMTTAVTVSALITVDNITNTDPKNLTIDANMLTPSSEGILYVANGGSISIGSGCNLTGPSSTDIPIVYTLGNISIGNTTQITGNIRSGGTLTLDGVTLNGTAIGLTGGVILENNACIIQPEIGRPAIISTGQISIENFSHNIRGLVFTSRHTGTDDCVISGGTINGAIVVGNNTAGELTLNGSPTITWYPESFTTTLSVYNNFANSDVFPGGQRVYLPAIGGWK